MQEENNTQPANNAVNPVDAAQHTPGKVVIQPSDSFAQEIHAQQPVSTPQQALQQPVSVPQAQPSAATPSSAAIYPDPASNQLQGVMSASQMGFNEPKNKLINIKPKQLVIKGLVGLVVLGVIFTVLVMTNIIALREFKKISYTNNKGTNFELDFYSKHESKQLKTGNKALVSKVSKDGKFPLQLSMTTGDVSELNKNGIKTCSGPLPKAFDVHNNNIGQTISVCYLPIKNDTVSVFVAGIEYNNLSHIVTIAQDLGDIDLSSPSDAKESLTKFGMEPYRADIERIVSSIKVK